MTRYIDADGLFGKYQKWLEETPYTNQSDVQLGQRIVLCDIYHDLKYAPAIDTICGISIDDAFLILTKYLNGEMVDVVRCKDCKHQEFYYKTIDGGESFFCKETGMVNMHIDDGDGEFWCKSGERRGEE